MSKCGDHLQRCMCGNGGAGKFARTEEEIKAAHQASLKRAKKFGWDRMAADYFRTLAFYQDLCLLAAQDSQERSAA